MHVSIIVGILTYLVALTLGVSQSRLVIDQNRQTRIPILYGRITSSGTIQMLQWMFILFLLLSIWLIYPESFVGVGIRMSMVIGALFVIEIPILIHNWQIEHRRR